MRCVDAGSALRNLQGTLLAIMNVAVLVLPLVQLWVSTHKLLNALRIKALALIRSKLGCARPAADVPPEAEGVDQVSSRCIASKPSRCAGALFTSWSTLSHCPTSLPIVDRCPYAPFRQRLHRLMLSLSAAPQRRSASNAHTDFSRGADASAEHMQPALRVACAVEHDRALRVAPPLLPSPSRCWCACFGVTCADEFWGTGGVPDWVLLQAAPPTSPTENPSVAVALRVLYS